MFKLREAERQAEREAERRRKKKRGATEAAKAKREKKPSLKGATKPAPQTPRRNGPQSQSPRTPQRGGEGNKPGIVETEWFRRQLKKANARGVREVELAKSAQATDKEQLRLEVEAQVQALASAERARARQNQTMREVAEKLHSDAKLEAKLQANKLEADHDRWVMALSVWYRLMQWSPTVGEFVLELVPNTTRNKLQNTQELESLRMTSEILVQMRQLELQIAKELEQAAHSEESSQGALVPVEDDVPSLRVARGRRS
jgi:hypothetical protein